MRNKQFFFLSGLPRSGTTLFSNLIMQNPDIYSGGNSPVCQLMWDVQQSCETKCSEQLIASKREDFKKELISSIPNEFYKNVDRKIIIDKCRSWTLKNNYKMIKEYISNDPKILVFVRDIEEIIKSLIRIGFIPKTESEENIFTFNSPTLMEYFYGIIYAKQYYKNNICLIDYNEFIKNTDEEMTKIYNFLEIDYFQHTYTNIVDNRIENDGAYGVEDMHLIRNSVKKQKNNIEISEKSKIFCKSMNDMLFKQYT